MKIVLTGPAPEKKIHAIKAVRAVTGLGLKEAKDAVEVLERGGEATVSVSNVVYLNELDEYGLHYRVQPVPMVEFIDTLRSYPGHMAVGDLVAVLTIASLGAVATPSGQTERPND